MPGTAEDTRTFVCGTSHALTGKDALRPVGRPMLTRRLARCVEGLWADLNLISSRIVVELHAGTYLPHAHCSQARASFAMPLFILTKGLTWIAQEHE